MLVSDILYFILILYCYTSFSLSDKTIRNTSNRSERMLQHVNRFLQDIQQEIKFGSVLVNDLDSSLKSSAGVVVQAPGTDEWPDYDFPMTFRAIERVDVSYLLRATDRLLELLIWKDSQHVMEVMKHCKTTYENLRAQGRLQWLGEPLSIIIPAACDVFNSMPHEQIRPRLRAYRETIRARNFSERASEIVNRASEMILTQEGELMYDALDNFMAYPGNMSAQAVCLNLFEGFERPYRRLEKFSALQDLMRDANQFIDNSSRNIPVLKSKNDQNEFSDDVNSELALAEGVLDELAQIVRGSKKLVESLDVDSLFNFSTVMPPILKLYSRMTTIKKPLIFQTSNLVTLPWTTRSTRTTRSSTKSTTTTKATQATSTKVKWVPDITRKRNPTVNTGYLTVGFEKFMEYMYTKETRDVGEVLRHSRDIMKEFAKLDKFSYLGHPLGLVFCNALKTFADTPPNVVKERAEEDFRIYRNRYLEYSAPVNYAMDKLNELINRTDGERLFKAVEDFHRFPKVNKTSKQVMADIVDGFLNIFGDQTRPELLSAIALVNEGLKYYHSEWIPHPQRSC